MKTTLYQSMFVPIIDTFVLYENFRLDLAAKLLVISIFEIYHNIYHFLSSLFVFVCFIHLFNKTLQWLTCQLLKLFFLKLTFTQFQQLFMNEILQFISLIPPVTRTYLGLCCFVTFLVQFDIITPFHIYFNWNLIVKEFQLWRLVSSFLYLGSSNISFIFNLIFSYRYSRMLEEDSFAFRTADFVFLYLYGAVFMIVCGIFTNTVFLGQAFTIMLVYIWGRRNPDVRLNFLGTLTFGASYLSYFLFFLSILMNQSVVGDILGISAGHIYYFLEDVYPREHNGQKILKTPSILKRIFDPAPLAEVPVDERAGGMAWGANGDVDER